MQSSRSVVLKARPTRLLVNSGHIRAYSTPEAASDVEAAPAVKKSSIPKLDSLGGISLGNVAQSTTGFQIGVDSLSVDQFAPSGGASFAARLVQRQSPTSTGNSQAPTSRQQSGSTLLHRGPYASNKIAQKPLGQMNEARLPQARRWDRQQANAAESQNVPYNRPPRVEGRVKKVNDRNAEGVRRQDSPQRNGQQRNVQQGGQQRDGKQQDIQQRYANGRDGQRRDGVYQDRSERRIQQREYPSRGENDRRRTVKAEGPSYSVKEAAKPRAPPKPVPEALDSPKAIKARDTVLNAMSVHLITGAGTTLPAAATESTVAAVAAEAVKPRKTRTKISKGALERYAGDYSRLLDPTIVVRPRVTDLNAFDHARLTTARVRGLGPGGRERALGIVSQLTGTTAAQPHV